MRMDLATRGTVLLVAATIVVGISILANGMPSRLLNGLAGILWFAAAAMLVIAAVRISRNGSLWVGIVALTAVVAFVVRPSDMLLAAVGFLACGAIAQLLARDGRLIWSVLIPALYLPLHIGTAVIKAVVRSIEGQESSIRTDPPPTAALVPLLMVVAAVVGGLLVQRVRHQDNTAVGRLT